MTASSSVVYVPVATTGTSLLPPSEVRLAPARAKSNPRAHNLCIACTKTHNLSIVCTRKRFLASGFGLFRPCDSSSSSSAKRVQHFPTDTKHVYPRVQRMRHHPKCPARIPRSTPNNPSKKPRGWRCLHFSELTTEFGLVPMFYYFKKTCAY